MTDLRSLQRRLEQLDPAPRSLCLSVSASGLWHVSIEWKEGETVRYESASTDREALHCALTAVLNDAEKRRWQR